MVNTTPSEITLFMALVDSLLCMPDGWESASDVWEHLIAHQHQHPEFQVPPLLKLRHLLRSVVHQDTNLADTNTPPAKVKRHIQVAAPAAQGGDGECQADAVRRRA